MIMKISNEYITSIVNSISEKINPSEIYMFGSQASGNASQDSDIDLCIIYSEKSKRKRDLTREIRKSISPILAIPMDILVYYEDEFYEQANLAFTIEHAILDKGIKLYG